MFYSSVGLKGGPLRRDLYPSNRGGRKGNRSGEEPGGGNWNGRSGQGGSEGQSTNDRVFFRRKEGGPTPSITSKLNRGG